VYTYIRKNPPPREYRPLSIGEKYESVREKRGKCEDKGRKREN
jgi:hypothetical protein